MGFTLGIDLSAGVSAILDAISKIAPGIAEVRQSIDPDIRRRGDLMWLYMQEAAVYPLLNGIADAVNAAGGQLQKIPQPGPLPTTIPANVTQPPLKMEPAPRYTAPTASSSDAQPPNYAVQGGVLGAQGNMPGLSQVGR